MASFNDIATSLRVTTQLPLDNKAFSVSQAALSNLGDANNLAFTYYDNMKAFCWNEKTEWVWREVQAGEEDTGLVPSDFLYPNGVVYPNPGYEGKSYNFFQIVPGTATKLTAGTSITITGNGSLATPYVINSTYVYTPLPADTPPLQTVDEGNGNGIIRRGRTAANFGNIGLNAIDLSTHSVASLTHGATGASSFAFGDTITANTTFSMGMGESILVNGAHSLAVGKGNSCTSSFGFVSGTNNVTVGKGNTIHGVDNNCQGTSMMVIGQAATIQTHSTTDYNVAPTRPLLLIGNGIVDNVTNLATFRSDAFIVRYNGIIEAPNMSIANITAGVARTLATKEYVANISGKNYKEYVVTLDQSGTNSPTIVGGTPLQNELTGNVIWTRSGVGDYRGTLISAFTNEKTTVVAHGFLSNPGSVIIAHRTNNDVIVIRTFTSGVAADSLLNNTSLLIRVYN